MLSLRRFMFERVYLGPHTAEEHTRARETVRRIFGQLADRGDSPAEIVDYLSGMTDRFALQYAASPLVARIKDTSVDAVKAAANIVDLVEARTRLRKVGGRYTGPVPLPPGEDAVVLGLAGSRHVPLLRLRGRRRRDLVRAGDRRARLRRRDRVARRPLLGPARVRGLDAGGGRAAQAQGAALRAARTGSVVLRARALVRVGEGGPGVPRVARPRARTRAASSASGSRPEARSRRRRARRGSPQTS